MEVMGTGASTEAPGRAAPPRVGDRVRTPLEMRRNIVAFTERTWRAQGDVYRLVIGPPGPRDTVWVVSHPDGAAKVLSGSSWTRFAKHDAAYDELRYWFGENLLTAWGDEWTRQKRFIQPLFTARAVDGYAALMTDEVGCVLDEWAPTPEGVVDLGEQMATLALRVAVRALFGDSAGEVIRAIRASFPPLSDLVARRSMAPLRSPHSWPTPGNRRARAAQSALYAACDEIIAHRRAGRTTGTLDLLGRLLAARDGGQGLSDQEVRDQVLLFLLAGQETTAIALTFALHLLGRHPDVQEAVRAEVADVAGSRTPTAADAHELALTSAVLKEALRLYPSVPFFGRRVVAEDELLGHPVPVGTAVIVAPWNIHRRPDLWPDPLRFDPTRFLQETETPRHRYAWMPFGGGPRACIGQHFSLLEGALALAVILRRYSLEARTPADLLPVDTRITLYPLEPVRATIRVL